MSFVVEEDVQFANPQLTSVAFGERRLELAVGSASVETEMS